MIVFSRTSMNKHINKFHIFFNFYNPYTFIINDPISIIRNIIFIHKVDNNNISANSQTVHHKVDIRSQSVKLRHTNIKTCNLKLDRVKTLSCHEQYLAKKLNKIKHTENGNISKNKVTKCIKFLLMNKGNANFERRSDSIKHIIDELTPNIAVIDESNINKNNDDHKNEFPQYDFEHKFENNSDITRTTMMFKKDSISYECLKQLENENIATIWTKIKITPKKSVLVMGGYRQWKLPHTANQNNSGSTQKQIERFQAIINQIKKARKINKNIIILMDSNIDLHDQMNRADIKELKEIYNEMLLELNLTILNKENTRHRSGNVSSYLDHIICEDKGNIDNIKTIHSYFSDHDVIIANYFTGETIFTPQFRWNINFTNLTPENLKSKIDANEKLKNIDSLQSSEEVWLTIFNELNAIINELAPRTRVQIKKRHKKYFNKAIKAEMKNVDRQLCIAIQTNNNEEWRLFRHMRNSLYKNIETRKKEYYENCFKCKKQTWNVIKEETQDSNTNVPIKLIFDDEYVTKPIEISNKLNSHLIDKVVNTNQEFEDIDMEPIELLSRLIPRVKNQMVLPKIKRKETYNIIKKMKNSSTCGHDRMNARIMKMIPSHISRLLTTAINKSIEESKYPAILKRTRILPILKKGKTRVSPDSYRPIANLPTCEKVFQEYLKKHLNNHIDNNHIMLENHHGGIKNRSTITAKAIIDHKNEQAREQNKIAATISTDLSLAYDTVSHPILYSKMEHYGVRGKVLDLFKSMFTNRTQFIELQTFTGVDMVCPAMSTIQGSKTANIFFNLYNNEAPLVHKLLEDEEVMMKLLKKEPMEIESIEHTVENFVDDSNSVIAAKPESNIKEYINNYMLLMSKFYTMMKLKMNPEKTSLMINAKPSALEKSPPIEIRTENGEIIEGKNEIKILGYITSNKGSNLAQINHLVMSTSNMLYKARKIDRYMTTEQRYMFAHAHIMSRLNYSLPLCINETEVIKSKLHSIVMKTARFIRGSYCFKESTKSILSSVKLKPVDELLAQAGAKFLQKQLYFNSNPTITHLFRKPKHRESNGVTICAQPKTNRFQRILLNSCHTEYNKLPVNMRSLHPNKMKLKLKKINLNQAK